MLYEVITRQHGAAGGQGQPGVRAGPHPDVQVGLLGRGRGQRVHHDDLAAVLLHAGDERGSYNFV